MAEPGSHKAEADIERIILSQLRGRRNPPIGGPADHLADANMVNL